MYIGFVCQSHQSYLGQNTSQTAIIRPLQRTKRTYIDARMGDVTDVTDVPKPRIRLVDTIAYDRP